MVTRKQTADGPSPEFKRIMDEEASLLAMIREGGNQSKLQRRFRRLVYRHYETQGRDFPWRRTDDPYHILVSEIMLQQTQTQRVAEKYASFIASFPGFESLAGAPLHDVLAAWQGLGYNRRALNLQKCARAIVGEHGGTLPENPDDLALLPGIGRATAASIAAFAFNKPVVFLETNIRTVFIYLFLQGPRNRIRQRTHGNGKADARPYASRALVQCADGLRSDAQEAPRESRKEKRPVPETAVIQRLKAAAARKNYRGAGKIGAKRRGAPPRRRSVRRTA
jgi:endonuclease III